MNKRFSIILLAALLAIPFIGFGQENSSLMGRSISVSESSSKSGVSLGAFSSQQLNQVLTLAAPYYGMPADLFIREYNSCGCITVTQIGPSTYYVVYGGIGIQIVIDDGRYGRGNTNDQFYSTPKKLR